MNRRSVKKRGNTIAEATVDGINVASVGAVLCQHCRPMLHATLYERNGRAPPRFEPQQKPLHRAEEKDARSFQEKRISQTVLFVFRVEINKLPFSETCYIRLMDHGGFGRRSAPLPPLSNVGLCFAMQFVLRQRW